MTNSPEARTTTGEIIDQAATTTEGQNSAAAPGAPEAYTNFTAPEGTTLDPELIASAAPIFKELNLSQDQAQKLVDFHSKQATASREAAVAAVEKMQSDWVSQIKSDKDLGPILNTKVLPEIGRMKDRLPAEVRTAFNEAMNFTGAGNHPGVVKALYEMAKLVNEGSHVTGTAPSKHGQTPPEKSAAPTLAAAMYPHLPH